MLRADGCHEAQGYLFGRPMAIADARQLIAEMTSKAA